jgi:hypothetical protein
MSAQRCARRDFNAIPQHTFVIDAGPRVHYTLSTEPSLDAYDRPGHDLRTRSDDSIIGNPRRVMCDADW